MNLKDSIYKDFVPNGTLRPEARQPNPTALLRQPDTPQQICESRV
jgi:hypothetical protein